MKKSFAFSFILTSFLAISCQSDVTDPDSSSREIVLSVKSSGLITETKTDAVASLPSTLYWGATTGSYSESVKWPSELVSLAGSEINTGKYQTDPPTVYNYYVSNVEMSVGGDTVVKAAGGNNGIDVICGRTSTDNIRPSVTLHHIFARTGSISISVQNGNGTLSDVSYTIVGNDDNTGSAGRYNLRTEAWSDCHGFKEEQPITGSSDYYLVPGSYTITVTATFTRGEFVFNNAKSAGVVTLAAGKVNNLKLTWPEDWPGEDYGIRIACALDEWSDKDSMIDLEYYRPVSPVSPAVDMGGTSTVLYASWNVGATCETDFGDYFAWGEVTKRYTNSAASLQNNELVVIIGGTFAYDWSNTPFHSGISKNTNWTKYIPSECGSYWSGDGTPDNKLTLDSSDDVVHVQWGGNWRMPTKDELQWLVDNCDWAWQSNYNDSGINGYLVVSNANLASIFFPCAGYCLDMPQPCSRYCAGSYGYYRASSVYADRPELAWTLYIYGNPDDLKNGYFGYEVNGLQRYGGFSVRAVKPKS